MMAPEILSRPSSSGNVVSTFTFPPEPVQGFTVKLSATGDTCDLVCAGTLDGKDPSADLQPHLLALHDQLMASAVKLVRMDVMAVEYMNSSAVKCFMMWFIKAERGNSPYKIEITFNPQRTWQYVSFTTMGRIAPKVLTTVARSVKP